MLIELEVAGSTAEEKVFAKSIGREIWSFDVGFPDEEFEFELGMPSKALAAATVDGSPLYSLNTSIFSGSMAVIF